MVIKTISEPAAEPFDIAAAKMQVVRSATDDDVLITRQIKFARQKVETYLRQRLITQTVQMTFDCFAARIQIPIWPVQSIDKITYVDTFGATQTLATSEYQLITSCKPHEIAPAYLKDWPATLADFDTVKIDVVVGYGASGDDIPGDIMQAIYLALGDYYEYREDTVEGSSLSRLPNGVHDMLTPHIFWV